MNPGAAFLKLVDSFSPRAWLLVAVMSLVAAAGSGVLLLSRQGIEFDDVAISAYDWARRFSRDTIRLTFKTDEGPQETVFVAPRGILEQATVFKVLEKFDDFVPQALTVTKNPLAPPQMLDPEWTPVFSGNKEEADS